MCCNHYGHSFCRSGVALVWRKVSLKCVCRDGRSSAPTTTADLLWAALLAAADKSQWCVWLNWPFFSPERPGFAGADTVGMARSRRIWRQLCPRGWGWQAVLGLRRCLCSALPQTLPGGRGALLGSLCVLFQLLCSAVSRNSLILSTKERIFKELSWLVSHLCVNIPLQPLPSWWDSQLPGLCLGIFFLDYSHTQKQVEKNILSVHLLSL